MPASDLIHDVVRSALERDGWTVTHDPFVIEFKGHKVFADMAAERPLAAERSGRKIVVEVKSFVGASLIRDLEQALGQYQLYRSFLEIVAPDRELYLAVSQATFEDFLSHESISFVLRRYDVWLLVVNLADEEIVQWIKPNDTGL